MIRVERLSIRLGEFVLQDVNLEVNDGEYLVIMGPTGSGKTVLIECIAGLYRPAEGRIWIDGRRADDDPPEARKVAYVPQDYCLFPHMTVRRNIAYGMNVRGFTSADQHRETQRLAELLGIVPILDRYPLHLSGGEQQRAALARALAIDPKTLLLDEPLSALDTSTRDTLCGLLKDLQRELGVTIVHVSHSLDETLQVADRVAVFGRGTVLQVGDVASVLARPSNSFVARCVGACNVVPGEGHRDGCAPYFEAGRLRLPCRCVPEGPCTLVARPEALLLRPALEAVTGCDDPTARVIRCVQVGPLKWIDLQLDGQRLRGCLGNDDGDCRIHAGDRVTVHLREGHGHFVAD